MTIRPQTHSTELPTEGRYHIDPEHSSITFHTRHLFGLAAVAGSMQVGSGEITFNPQGPRASVTATVNAASFDTGHRKRDTDVRKPKFLNVEQYPEITFQGDSLQQEREHWTLTGRLTVRGVSRPVTLKITSTETTADGFRTRAGTRIDRYAFGLTAARGMAARHLDLELTITARQV